MSEAATIAITLVFVGVFGWLVRDWKNNWQNRIIAQDKRLDNHDNKHTEHDLNHAVLKANLEHIRATADETSQDVKQLLSNGKRTSNG